MQDQARSTKAPAEKLVVRCHLYCARLGSAACSVIRINLSKTTRGASAGRRRISRRVITRNLEQGRSSGAPLATGALCAGSNPSVHLRGFLAAQRHGAIGPSVPTDDTRTKIDIWIAAAPDTRIVETKQTSDRWTTQALEDGEVRYEETEFGADEPELNLLARWCERQATKVGPRPPVKTVGGPLSDLARKQSH